MNSMTAFKSSQASRTLAAKAFSATSDQTFSPATMFRHSWISLQNLLPSSTFLVCMSSCTTTANTLRKTPSYHKQAALFLLFTTNSALQFLQTESNFQQQIFCPQIFFRQAHIILSLLNHCISRIRLSVTSFSRKATKTTPYIQHCETSFPVLCTVRFS